MDPKVAPSLLSPAQIDQEEAGSPARALLEWWSAFQYADDDGVLKMTSPDVLNAVGANRLAQLVRLVRFNLPGIKIVSFDVEQDQAVVRALLLAYTLDKQGNVVEASFSGTPRSFAWAREGDDWRFDEQSYVEELLQQYVEELQNTDL